MDFSEIRRRVIIAMFADDTLFEQLALKGGNALNLIYGFGTRTSLDVDLSLEQDFENPQDSERRILQSLRGRFAEIGITVFDAKFGRRPLNEDPEDQKWGGYELEFKLMETIKYENLKNDMDRVRRESLVIGDGQQRIFRVQISKHEYCKGKIERELDDFTIYVYTPEMIVIEKIRAICQQMNEYPRRRHSTARARDFYDIYSTITEGQLDLTTGNSLDLVRNIFEAKSVPLSLMGKIGEYREFHRQDWPSVELTASRRLQSFDFYFDFVLKLTESFKSFWEV